MTNPNKKSEIINLQVLVENTIKKEFGQLPSKRIKKLIVHNIIRICVNQNPEAKDAMIEIFKSEIKNNENRLYN